MSTITGQSAGQSPEGVPAGAAEVPVLPFEAAMGELESIVQQMEGTSLSLEDSLAAYRRGASLVAQCRRALASAEQQVRVLEGELLEPFDDDLGGGPAA